MQTVNFSKLSYISFKIFVNSCLLNETSVRICSTQEKVMQRLFFEMWKTAFDNCTAHCHCFAADDKMNTVVKLRRLQVIITFYSPSCHSQKTVKATFRSSSQTAVMHLPTSLPQMENASYCPFVLLNVKQGSYEYQIFTVFSFYIRL